MNREIQEKARNIKLAVFDVDGVMTDGTILVTDEGELTKQFSVRDGLGLKLLRSANVRTAVISGRESRPLLKRLGELDIDHFRLGIDDKLTEFKNLVQLLEINDSEVCCFGDDLNDIAILRKCGLSVVPAGSPDYMVDIADYVTFSNAGHGAVREVCELILKAKGTWQTVLESYF